MKVKDPDRMAAIEKAISKKYGEEAIKNLRAAWDEAAEKEYLEQMKRLYEKVKTQEEYSEKVDVNGIKISTKLLNRESLKSCPVCGVFPKKSMDDVCLTKFDCCYKCYIQYVEGREERWLTGWRPNNENFKITT